MVFSKGHNTPWSIHEQRMLLEQFLVSPDWVARSAEMCKEFCDTRSRGYFSPKNCQTEFDRLLQTPCPGHKVSATSTSTFSRKAMVDIWINYLNTEIEKEDEKTFELELVELRKKSSIIERLVGKSGGSSYASNEVNDLLYEARANDSKVSDQHQLCHVVNSYMHRLKEVMHNCNLKEEDARKADSEANVPPISLNDLTALDDASASPSRSPLKSPIRAIADVYREHMSPAMEQPSISFPPSNPFNNDSTNSITAKNTSNSQDGHKEKVANPEKTSRRKGKKEPKEEAEATVSDDTPSKSSKDGNKRKPSRTEALDDIQVENSPAGGRRSSRRGVVDSPLISSRSKKGKVADRESVESEEKKPRSDATEEQATPEVPAAPAVAEIPEEPGFIEIGTMTEISIQPVLWSHQEKKENRRSAAARKSTRRSEANVEEKTDVVCKEIAIQTRRIEFDKDDKIVVSWNTYERVFVKTVGLETKKLKEEDWSDDDDDALATLAKKNTSVPAEEEEEEKKIKHDSKKDFLVIYDTDDWLARLMLMKPNFKTDDGKVSFSPTKRPRKEEKGKDDSITTKAYLLNIWRMVCNHKHSGIFSHPVNEKEAPGYGEAIKQKMDLSTLKKEIESGQVSNLIQLKMKLGLMFANAIMFNSTGHDVNTYAQEMAKETMDELCRLGNLSRKLPLGPSRRSRVQEEIVTKFAPKSRTMPVAEAPKGKVRQIFARRPSIFEVRRVPS